MRALLLLALLAAVAACTSMTPSIGTGIPGTPIHLGTSGHMPLHDKRPEVDPEVAVSSSPDGAEVWFNGRLWGVTETTFHPARAGVRIPGSYPMEVRMTGYAPRKFEVMLDANEQVYVRGADGRFQQTEKIDIVLSRQVPKRGMNRRRS